MTCSPLPVLVGLVLFAPGAALPARSAVGAGAAAKAKDSVEAQFARQNFKQVLDAVNDKWFGAPYAGINAVDLQGTLTINLSAAAVNAKLAQAGQGMLKSAPSTGATVKLNLKGTYFANADFRIEMTGDFGHLLYYRVGDKGFLYSKEQNAWTSRVDPPPTDAPSSFLGWFRQCLNDVQAVYVDGTTFKARLGQATGVQQALSFSSPTRGFDAKQHEQNLAASLGFWKHGQLEVVFDKGSRLPQQMNFSNENQGVSTQATFSHTADGRLSQVVLNNQSRGMEGPAALSLGYGGGGLLDHLNGQMGFSKGTLRFDLDCAFVRDRKVSTIVTVPPPTATKKGREELETLLMVGLAGKLLDLQHNGFNLRSVAVGAKS